MTRHLIGTVDELTKRLQDCEGWVERLASAGVAGSRSNRSLRAELGSELASVVSSSASLQREARTKLSPPDERSRVWWVTEKSLQQATPWQVAKAKAAWFDSRPVFDLCCGIGGDAVRLAARGPVTAVDLDYWLAAMAQANLWDSAASNAERSVVCGNAGEIKVPASAGVHIDPDRRPGQRRRSDPDAFEPPWSLVSQMIATTSSAVVKLAPASVIPERGLPASEFHRCWISLSGSVREQSLLWGDAVERAGLVRGQTSALVMRGDGDAAWFVPEPSERSSVALPYDGVPALLVDPNPAIRAAGLTEALANRYDLRLLSGPAGFLAGQEPALAANASLRKLAVVAPVRLWCACDDRKLRKELRALGVFPQRIKVRGSEHDPAALVKRYRSCGEQPVTLWIGRYGRRTFAAVTD